MSESRLRVLLVEPWLGGSHEAWARGYQRHSGHDVEILGLPGELWRWRLRAGAVPLARSIREHIDAAGPPDLLLVSGLVDVASLVGLVRRSLPAATAVVTFMHETQLLYPTSDGAVDEAACLANWRSWCASDLVVFNSSFHRDAVVAAMPRWLEQLPDRDQGAWWPEVSRRFEVLPVGVEPPDRPAGSRSRSAESPPIILWPHRWERDKRPDVFARALDKLAAAGLEFELVLAGEEIAANRSKEQILRSHGHRTLASGPFDRPEYERWLERADLVVSCAEHEFFGVAVVEAMSRGCVPLVPDALAYPELIRPHHHALALYEPGRFGSALIAAVRGHGKRQASMAGLAKELEAFSWPHVAPRYDERLERLAVSLGP